MLVCTVEPATTDDIPALFGQRHISHPLSHLIQAFWSRGKKPISSFSVVVVVVVFVEVASALRY